MKTCPDGTHNEGLINKTMRELHSAISERIEFLSAAFIKETGLNPREVKMVQQITSDGMKIWFEPFPSESEIELYRQRAERAEAEIASLREQVTNLQMSETHKIRVQVVKHMLEQTSFICKCFALDVFRNYPRLRDEGLKILDGELDNEVMI